MSKYVFPGVYIEEITQSSQPIEGVSTTTAGFIGLSAQAAAAPVTVTSIAEFERVIGSQVSGNLPFAVRGFFENGGTRCLISRLAPSDPLEAGLEALASEKLSILCCPDEHNFPHAARIMAAHCELRKDRFCILQSPGPVLPDAAHHVPVHSAFAAYYHPWLVVPSLDRASEATVPPGGHIAGVYARTDEQRGVHKAPANETIAGVQALSQEVNTAQATLLTSRGINVLRNLSGKGIMVWGARTTSEDPQWKYVPVRRLLIFVEESIHRGLQWVAFEPNAPALWANVRQTVENFLNTLWRAGALAGVKPEEAYFVRCDQTTISQMDLDARRLVLQIGIAPNQPAEFIILRLTFQSEVADSPSSP